jgi:hypothetical protein
MIRQLNASKRHLYHTINNRRRTHFRQSMHTLPMIRQLNVSKLNPWHTPTNRTGKVFLIQASTKYQCAPQYSLQHRPTLTMTSRLRYYGHAPRHTTHCPLCDDPRVAKEGKLVKPRPVILERYGVWCQALNCRTCKNEWYICTQCFSTRVAIDTIRKVVRHASCFHSTSKRATKRKADGLVDR